MNTPRHIAVIDIGKTNAKLALVDLPSLTEIAVVTRPNLVLSGPPWPHYDVEGHWAFLLGALSDFHATHGVDAISVTTHGACAALLAQDGTLAAPILDYEQFYPTEVVAAYDSLRPPFAETGSPRLAGGLNIGAQLHYQFAQDPSLRARTHQIVTYPQYWGHRLTGVGATDVSSIGCHTDLWDPRGGKWSSLPAKLGILDKLAPVRKPAEQLGPILPAVATATGLPRNTPVCVGLHDSNASLYPHLLALQAPFSVVSTGTWVIAMAIGGKTPSLDPDRDTLVNVDANGNPVPSARFVGGREFELIQQGHYVDPTPEALAAVLSSGLMLLPAVDPSCGPFAGHSMGWSGDAPAPGTPERSAALALYLAMMTQTCLDLIGATGSTIVEGPFAQNKAFTQMLGAATARPVLASGGRTGSSIGAALLAGPSTALAPPHRVESAQNLFQAKHYASRWRALAGRTDAIIR